MLKHRSFISSLHSKCRQAIVLLCMSATYNVSAQVPITQTFDAPQERRFTSREVAQLDGAKIPSLATESFTTDTVRLSSYETTGSRELMRSIDSLTSTVLTDDARSTTGEALGDILVSLPPYGYEAETTSVVLTDYLSTDYTDLDTSLTETPLETRLPLTPLPLEELESLSSASKSARRISLMDGIYQALAINQTLKIDRLRPEVSNAGIENAWSEFDTVLESAISAGYAESSTRGPRSRNGGPSAPERTNVSRDIDFTVGLRGRAPTGTNYSLGFDMNRRSSNTTLPFYTSGLNANITQNLLRGAGVEVNLVNVRLAENNYIISLYQLQNALNGLVTDVQDAYWDVYLAQKTLEIRLKAYQVSRQQREQTEEFVRVGRAAPLDAYSAQAEESSRVSDIITAAADLKRRQLILLQLINPDCISTGWRTLIFPNEVPVIPSERLVPEERVRLARYYRPDLRQAEIDLANGELEVFRSENGLLPVLDFVTNAGLTGVGDNLNQPIDDIGSLQFPNIRVGLQFSYPLQNRQARSAHRRAQFQRRIAEEAIKNFCQIIEVEIRSAIIEIERTERLIESTEVTVLLRQKELEAETEKFRVGRSTQVLVNQVQRDLIQAALDQVAAEVAHMKAYLRLYLAEGTVLQRRGIQPIHVLPASGVASN